MKIIHEVEKCVSCGSCVAVCPERWEMAKTGKAHLLNSKKNPQTGNEELEGVQKIGCIQEAVDICPVQCIRIEK